MLQTYSHHQPRTPRSGVQQTLLSRCCCSRSLIIIEQQYLQSHPTSQGASLYLLKRHTALPQPPAIIAAVALALAFAKRASPPSTLCLLFTGASINSSATNRLAYIIHITASPLTRWLRHWCLRSNPSRRQQRKLTPVAHRPLFTRSHSRRLGEQSNCSARSPRLC